MMNIKRLLAVLAVAPIGFGAIGCDEHPRSGQVENERVAEAPDEETPQANQPEQAGAEGSELVAQTGPRLEQCIEVVERVMRCTSNQPFIQAVTSEDEGMSREEVSRMSRQWQEPGTVRRSCEQLLQTEANNPFGDAEQLEELEEAAGQECSDFAEVLIESGAVEIISNANP